MPRTALFAGSFDPFTIGHQSVVDRALPLFDHIIIGIGVNPAKRGWMPVEERMEAIRTLYATEPRVSVMQFTGLTVEAARTHGAQFLLRGVRTLTDFEYERNLADVNRNLSGLESVLIYTLPEHAAVSSSVVRELASHGVDIAPYLPTQPSVNP